MINSVQESALTLTSNSSSIPFNTDVVRTNSANCCGWLSHSTGSSIYQITKGGLYEISYNANITSATAGVVGLTLRNNGEQMVGSEGDSVVATANQFDNIGGTRLLRVCGNGTASITLGSVATINGVATQIPIVKNVSFIIEKLA